MENKVCVICLDNKSTLQTKYCTLSKCNLNCVTMYHNECLKRLFKKEIDSYNCFICDCQFDISVLKDITLIINKSIVLYNIKKGNLENLKLFHLLGYNYNIKLGINFHTYMDLASTYGHLDVVKFLHSIGVKYTSCAIVWASTGGHLEVVKFLHSIGAKCITDTMDYTSCNGHIEVVKFLH